MAIEGAANVARRRDRSPRVTTTGGDLIYQTSSLIEAIELAPISPSHLRDLMFSEVIEGENSLVAVDVLSEGARLAPFVSVYSRGSTQVREKYQTHIWEAPMVAPVTVLTGDDLTKRIPGENWGGGENAAEREMYYLVRDETNLDASITRLEEWMCAQVLFTGSVPIRDYDSGRLMSRLTYGTIVPTVPSLPWTDAGSLPLNDISAAMRYVSSNAHVLADVVVFGSEAARLFENNTSVKEAYNNLWIRNGTLTPEQRQLGIVQIGTYRSIELIANELTYTDKDGSTSSYVPPTAVLVACSQNPGKMCYGGIAQPSDDESRLQVYVGRRIPYVWFPDDADVRKFRLASRPLPVPPPMTFWTVITVV